MKWTHSMRGYARIGLAIALLSTAACAAEEDVLQVGDEEALADEEIGEQTSALAGGSWRSSCKNAYEVPTDFGKVVLYATCRRKNGSWRDTAYFDPYSCGPGLTNCDGQLKCGC